jgi:hypothetical protein
MASAVVLVRVVRALARYIISFHSSSSIILTHLKHISSYSHQKMGPERDFYEGRQRAKQTERQPRIVVYFIKLSTWMIKLVSGVSEYKNRNKKLLP